jgi:hypothetical protein
MKWFRLYSEAVDDEKLRLLAFEDRWHFVAILCLKSQGILDNLDDEAMQRRKVAVKLGVQLRELDEIARRLAEVGLLDQSTLQPLAWDRRQYKSDNAASRVAEHRERKAKACKVTRRYSNVTVTPPDTDTDTDADIGTVSEGVQGESQSVAAAPHRRAQKGGSRFSAPTLDQVADYCHERGNQIDPEKFHDYYESNGWKVGKSAMKDWKAAVRNWEKRNEEHQRAGGKREQTFEQKLEFLKRRSGEII